MSNANDARKAHKILDDLLKGNIVLDEEREFLRNALPEPPKQKTLEEIIIDVRGAWSCTSGNDWGGDICKMDVSIEDWLSELREQLQGLKDVPANTPALPAGMRLADHEQYGRVVTSPKPNRDGVYDLLVPRPKFETGTDWDYAHECELTFIDYEPAHPEFLETEADYREAPEGTIVAEDKHRPAWKPTELWFINNNPFDNREMAGGLSPAPRRVLRWGWGK